MPSLFSHLILDVEDIDRSLAFYSGLLHLPVRRKESFDGHQLAYLTTGQTEILLVQQPKHDQNPALDRSGGLVIIFHVRNLPTIAGELKEHQVPVLRGLEDPTFGERTVLVSDPDGYAIMLSESAETLH